MTDPAWHTTALPKRSSKKSNASDISQLARAIVEAATGESLTEQPASEEPAKEPPRKKHPAAVALGKLGGKKGGPARRDKLSPERRKEIAQKAAEIRWRRRKSLSS
jgi:hypothetical protein